MPSRHFAQLQLESLEARHLMAVDLLSNIVIEADANFIPRDISPYKGQVLLRGDNGQTGAEAWITNGTPEGTRLLKDIWIGERGSGARDFTPYNDKLYFVANNGTLGLELWVTEGTSGTTRLISDVWPGTEPGAPTELTVYKDFLYFVANDGESGRELYRTDGTPSGTVRVADSIEGRSGSSGENMMVINDLLFFESDSNVPGQSGLWTSDGTAEGTQALPIDGINEDDIDFMMPYGDRLLFTSNGNLWLTDGTTEGSAPIQTVGDPLGPNIESIFISQGKIYVVDDLGLHEISSSLTTNTTLAGTAKGATESSGKVYYWDANGFYVVNANNAPDKLVTFNAFFGAEFAASTSVNGGLIFSARRILDQFDIYVTDGTKAGTQVIESATDTSSEPFADIQQIRDQLYFTATNGNFYESVWTIPAPVIEITDPPGIPGDVNQDDIVNAQDIDALYAAIAASSTDSQFDVDENGSVNSADADFLIENILGTKRGDLDLNGRVEFADFLALSASFASTNATWSNGDTDGNGTVDFADFLALSANFGFAAALAQSDLID